VGSSPAARAAWNALTAQQQSQYKQELMTLAVPANQKAFAAYSGTRGNSSWAGFPALGSRLSHNAININSITSTPIFDTNKGSHPNVTQQIPSPQATASPTSGPAPLTVTFVGVTYPFQYCEAGCVQYDWPNWSFGDGQNSPGSTVTHTYATPGNYIATFSIFNPIRCDIGGPCFIASVAISVTGTKTDSDQDGLPNTFEAQVANLLTPFYHVSTSEKTGTGFAIFGDFVPETPVQIFGPVPPRSYFRVTPMGFANGGSTQYGFVRLDYLTLWNRDDGLSIGGLCAVDLTFALDLAGFDASQILNGATSHPLDNERSAVLIAAPTTAFNTYDTNANNYFAYSFFTAAHEGTVLDRSQFYDPSPPVPVSGGAHLVVFLSRAKHGTYTFNPNGLPLVPDVVIVATFETIQFLFDNLLITPEKYYAYSVAAYSAFYECVIEHFGDQGGEFGLAKTNVGEIAHPSVGFILDPKLSPKLTVPLWRLQ
jgi:hypothetical protein